MTTLVIGAAASGKSEYAESLLRHCDKKYYLATLADAGADSKRRIKKHRQSRLGKGFCTIECPHSLYEINEETLPKGASVLLECMGNLAANEMFLQNRGGAFAFIEIKKGIKHLEERCKSLIIVTNDVFCEEIAYDEKTTEYIELLARCNAAVAANFDNVIEISCGIPIVLKGEAQ